MAQGPRTRSVGRQHPADGTVVLTGRVRGEAAAVLGEPVVQPFGNDAGLHADGVRADLDDLAEVLAEIEDQP